MERQLILLSAGTAARRADMHQQAVRLMSDVDWSHLCERLRRRRLLPTLGPRIVELGEGRASDTFAEAVEQAIVAGGRRGAFLQLVALRIKGALAEARIRSTVLKGSFLSEAIYGDPGRRVSDDIDLLVATEQLPAAVEVAQRLGYSDPADYVQDGGLPALHFALDHGGGELPPLELHWRIHWYEQSFARERLLPPTLELAEEWRPAPADELAALLLFYARDGFVDLRLASDLSAWWDVFGAEVPAGALGELIRVYPAFGRVLPAAAEAADAVVGLPARHLIGDAPKLSTRTRMAIRLANPNPQTSQHQRYADMGLIDGLLAPTGGFGAFIRRKVLPPREVLDEYVRRSSNKRRISPVGYGTRTIARYGFALIQIMRGPEGLRRS